MERNSLIQIMKFDCLIKEFVFYYEAILVSKKRNFSFSQKWVLLTVLEDPQDCLNCKIDREVAD